MNLEELRSVRRAERQKDSLQHLRDSFYQDVADYIVQLKDERQRAVDAADDPFGSDEVRKLTDRIESTTEIANALYERRVGKVVKHASFAAADMATDEDGMTTEERELFEDLVSRIRANRETVLATLDGNNAKADATDDASAERPDASPGATDTEQPSTAPLDPEPTSTDPAPSPPPDAMDDAPDDLLADALGESTDDAADDISDEPPMRQPTADATTEQAEGTGERERSTASDAAETEPTVAETPTDEARPDADVAAATTEPEPSGTDTERVTLRITKDVPSFYGIDDRDYDLAPEDVVTLPTTNAEPLIQKDAAERID